eukprot:TRINITY_DN3051_c1_g1_i6.p1 TRINITY_DN3051_c1_g1~~TRINITY_DN3051_c1_g1_i6.p1  ORF type:complete len:108 (+),score=12.94 TRINITY_DN3051_c1_g1_i6:58-381(+)
MKESQNMMCHCHTGNTQENEREPEYGVPLVTLQTTWRPDTQPAAVNEFSQETGPAHTLPPTASPLDYFFLFLPLTFFTTAAEETNRYAQQKQAAKGTLDPLWSTFCM